ncbi:DUF2254 domain-containing protein [Martelella sp. HB161492]|uniref:DUF2254 family protein n=1 Tax=Martelella sp. HB161492 TaxID=2720726 RepID=UPI00158FD7AA
MKLGMSLFQIREAMRQIWFMAAAFCLAGVFTALAGAALDPYIPVALGDFAGIDAVGSLLEIIATSMLTVTVFSLNTLVSATSSAAQNATPRAVSNLLQDRTAQGALATFLGAFLFSLVGLIALKSGLYGDGGRFVLFAVTLMLIVLIVVMLLRWINHLGSLGQVSNTIAQVEQAAHLAMCTFREEPLFRANPFHDAPEDLTLIEHNHMGYLRFIDLAALNAAAEEIDADIYILERPGVFVTPGRFVAGLKGDGKKRPDDAMVEKIRASFALGAERSYDQDPLYGLTVLSQIAMRAMSPGINDPGTAIDVINNLVRVLAAGREIKAETEPLHRRLHIMPLAPNAFFDAAFTGISRDGAGLIEVGIALQRALKSLEHLPGAGYGKASRAYAEMALERAGRMLEYESERERLAAIASEQDLARYAHLIADKG